MASVRLVRAAIGGVFQHVPECDDDVSMLGALQISGDITYSGEPFANFHPQRTAAYVDQVMAPSGFHLTSHRTVDRAHQGTAR